MSSEQRTARETLEQAFRAGFAACQDNTDKYGEYNGDSIEEEFAAFAASLRAAPAPTGDYSAIEQDCRGCMGPCGRCHESGAAPAPEPEHVCGGCGYKWNWPVPSPIELCGDCWRKTWPVLRGAAPAPEGETLSREYRERALEWAESSGERKQLAELHGLTPHQVETLVKLSKRDMEKARIFLKLDAPASPGPTPEGRETARFRAAVSADYKAGYANGIREAKAETLREVRAKLGQWLDQGHSFTCPVYDGAPCTCGLSAALSALTGGTEGEQP
jgi:hypothetical protein